VLVKSSLTKGRQEAISLEVERLTVLKTITNSRHLQVQSFVESSCADSFGSSFANSANLGPSASPQNARIAMET